MPGQEEKWKPKIGNANPMAIMNLRYLSRRKKIQGGRSAGVIF
jgi:hypothetical protein